MLKATIVTDKPEFISRTKITDTTTTVEIQNDKYDHIFARGIAKLNPTDHNDPETGLGIAYGRALQKYGRKLERYWNSLSETVPQHKARMRAEKKDEELFKYFTALIEVQNTVNNLKQAKTPPRKFGPESSRMPLEAEIKPVVVTKPENKKKIGRV